MPSTMETSFLCKNIRSSFGTQIMIQMLPRNFFNDSKGLSWLKSISIRGKMSKDLMELNTRYFCLAAANGLKEYVVNLS